MAETIRVQNLAEAIALANHFKKNGKANLFRGQAQNWRVVSTLARIVSMEDAEVEEKTERFFQYCSNNKELQKYVENIDWFFAVAQHYGLPTPYIDFSSSVEIATYFATNSKANIVGEDCVIVCLDEDEFTKLVGYSSEYFTDRKGLPPYIVHPNVENLWRLQAQQGSFLYSPILEIENFLFDFDRIVFPFKESYNEIQEFDIYPKRKSELEILIDRFFDYEFRRKGMQNIEEFINDTDSKRYYLKTDNEDTLHHDRPDESWTTEVYKKWQYPLKEYWTPTINEIQIGLPSQIEEHPEDQINTNIQALNKEFKSLSIEKGSQLSFHVNTIDVIEEYLANTIQKNCSIIWHGMRNLPYSLNDIILVIAKYAAIEMHRNRTNELYVETNFETIRVELADNHQNSATSIVCSHQVKNAFRNNLDTMVKGKHSNINDSRLMLIVNKPPLLFNFDKLLELFKSDLICYQLLLNGAKDNLVVFFSPTEIVTLGYK